MNWKENLKLRRKTKKFTPSNKESQKIILQSPFDFGVIRNGGRRGTKYAPEAILASLYKLTNIEDYSISLKPPLYPPEKDLLSEFDYFQNIEMEHFKKCIIQSPESLVHLGGGHDHIYPLLLSLLSRLFQSSKKIVILNIDAHLDTRNDSINHSGTPFRQIHHHLNKNSKDFVIYQYGIHTYANHETSFEDMENMKVIYYENSIQGKLSENLKKHQEAGDFLFLSLDCDGLDGSFMSAVSAPNHNGLSKQEFNIILENCLDYWSSTGTPRLYGIYEYNPLYDDNAGTSARYLASTIHRFFSKS